jgi:hypothetical protein
VNGPANRKPSPVFVGRIAWIALAASAGLYYFVALQVDGRRPVAPNASATELPLNLASGGCFLLGYFLPRLSRNVKGLVTATAQPGMKGYMLLILRLAMFEAVALAGFVQTMLFSDASKMLPHLGLAARGFGLSFPTEALLTSWSGPTRPQI